MVVLADRSRASARKNIIIMYFSVVRVNNTKQQSVSNTIYGH